jgi:hypothetical protein
MGLSGDLFDETEEPSLPSGPALLYVHSGSALGGPWRTRVDAGRITEGGPLSEEDARRERMLLRALLNQALWLLGPEENEG